ncbi:uncharacterized protein BT62DRAFT_1071503 [Guyanagaster necrorhizus]|uniref:Myb-like domain-containing protein n=1 Tax=Guyanagaster necrorhizus TaxID=856835 RepID=A0A9P7W2V6_9AGAR|nr:uncharacterized protein BT62DRAFT_1071503 [Guyanagaster necrorhizus MCA 3950]KAG7452356.1 hypothetical protein BT62DRAFT_1071503 [Guyanagaster necrorhizus MCA 3950]
MTTRVQKGGAIFRPAIKARARSTVSVEPSSQRDIRESDAPPQTSLGSITTLPSVDVTESNPSPENRQVQNSFSSPPALYSQSSRNSQAPPVLAVSSTSATRVTSSVPPLNSSTKFHRFLPDAAALPVVVSVNQSSSFPSSQAISQVPESFLQPQDPPTYIDPSLTSTFPIAPVVPIPEFGTFDQQLTTFQHILHNSGTGNVPQLALDAESILKPPRQSARRNATSETPVALDSQPPQDKHVQNGIVSTETRGKRTKKDFQKESREQKPTRKRRKLQKEDNIVEPELDSGTPTPKRRRRSSSAKLPPRRKRSPSLPPFDPNIDPGEEIDPTVVTMALLCQDTGQGRISSKAAEIQGNHTAWKARNRERRARMKVLMERKKYGHPESDEERDSTEVNANKQGSAELPSTPTGPVASSSAAIDETGNGFDYSQGLTTSRYNVQVRIGPNGETIIDEESLTVDRDENDETENYTHVIESDTTKFTNSGTYGKRFRGSRWSAEETELFYDALSQYGENYELIAYVLPGRDRKSCKNKFKTEDKKNHARINYCLNHSKPVDVGTLSRMTGKDFSGPVPQILAPTPAMPVADRQSAPDSAMASTHTTPTIRKRSQSRKPVVTDDIQIVGQADSFDNS